MDKITDMTMEQTLQQANVILANLHFVRADWFYAFIPLALFLLLSYFKKQDDKNWLPVIDQKLLPFVLTKSSGKRRRYPLLLVFIAASLCITALAGPVYKKLPQPVFREQSSLVVLLDLSRSMNATDIKPSRLARAKLELLDILSLRKTGQTALVVYAADAFVVTPLTDDNATIANLVPSLATEMMPAQGSNLSIALAKTNELFIQAGINKGDILLITDDIHKREQKAIEKIVSQGHRLSIFGIGTADGAPIPLDESSGGGFLLDSDGAIVIPRLDSNKLQRMALSGGGLYTVIDAGDSDVNKLARLFESRGLEKELEKDTKEDSDEDVNNDLTADVWQEEGHWLLLPLLFFAALWARRGWLAIIILFALPLPQPAYAEPMAESAAESTIESVKADKSTLIDTRHLWSTPDQKAMKAFDSGDNKNAAQQFTDPDWKASAQYRDGDYQSVVDTLKDTDHSDGFYNKGNALANLGRYDEAIKAYDKAIELDPNNADAAHNREQVKQAQQEQEQQQNQQQDQDQDQQDQEQQDQQQQSQDQENQDSQQQDQQSGESQQDAEQEGQQQDDQQQGEQQPDTQQNQQMEDESLKQRDAEAEKEQEQQEQLEYQKQQEQQSEEAKDEQTSDSEEKNKQQVEQAESDDETDNKPLEIEVNPTEASITEEEKATEQWLKRIPDDPGGLLRRKFLYQYNQTQNQQDDDQPW